MERTKMVLQGKTVTAARDIHPYLYGDEKYESVF